MTDGPTPAPGVRPWAGALTAVGLLTAWNIVGRPALPQRWHLLGSLVVAGLVLVVAWVARMRAEDLGLARAHLGAGLRLGGITFAVVSAVLVVASFIPGLDQLFTSPRGEVGVGRLLLEALVTIPIGTVFVEELAFRGVLLGLLRSKQPDWLAVAITSVLFGLWHLQPVVDATSGSAARVAAAAVGTFAATTVAGVGFAWLRIRSESLAAPILAHIATNSTALVLAWVAVH